MLLAAAALLLTACGKNESRPDVAPGAAAGEESAVATIEGEVFYRERIMLPPGIEVEVQLQDISRADAPASVMATVMLQPDTAPPWPFSISYKPAEIDPRMRYALRATITREGQLLFSSTEYIDPFAGNPLKVLVQRVAEPVSPRSPSSASPGTTVSESNADDSPGAWLLETLGGTPAPPGAGGRPIDLMLDQQERTAAGFGGCNRYRGGFSSDGDSTHGTPITFGNMVNTMKFCADGAEIERSYLQMLGSVDAYRMDGEELALLSGEQVVATFKLQ